MTKKEKQIEGIIFKGAFCPYWGGVITNLSQKFFNGGLQDVSATILANNHCAGIVEVYEEDEEYGIQDVAISERSK